MVGLAGDLGQSICDWMIDHGARNIVLTSRSNKVPERWINACRARGATVAFVAGDITSDRSMQNAHTEITKRLPPIAGVANGALILRDKLFINTTFEDINAIMSPKTTGTIILDKLFPEDTLDWFIAFSSVVATSGNTGQCAYSAANMFMKTVVNDRRKRGLAGTSIDISRVHGVGYVERNAMSLGLSKKEMDKIQRFALSMSEPDLHQLFAEAVIASRPDSGRHSDLITGIRSLTSRDVADVFWAASLRFSHFVNDVEPTAGGATDNRQTRVVVKTQLKSAKSPDDVVAIIKTAFTAKLTASLEHDESNALPDSTPLVDFGMDSLVAVEIRSWFLKELEVEVPVLRSKFSYAF
jgi:short-subunit dehydrogenase/acyl carrier protein